MGRANARRGVLRTGARRMKDSYTNAAKKYAPEYGTRVLFIAEAPPDSIDRYFYFERVEKCDWLWIALMKGLYPQDWKLTKSERKHKSHWLSRFQRDGFQLIDALKSPISGAPNRRVAAIQNQAVNLIEEVRTISPKCVVLIKKTVHDALSAKLDAQGFVLANSRPIPFPSSGKQGQFQDEFSRLGIMNRYVNRGD
jgi:hypothetical protein